MIIKIHIPSYMLDLPCVRSFKPSQWRALPRKEKRNYRSPGSSKW